jgi:uncharacterized protein YbaA (DUF1428 family)
MKSILAWWVCGVMAAGFLPLRAAETNAASCYELRIYYAAPGRLDQLNARFREHTCKLFEKHGIRNVGYWVPTDNPERRLVFLLAYPNRAARDQAWEAFMGDPEWIEVYKTSEASGRLVERVENVFLQPTDFSPELKIEAPGKRVFELRTYTAAPGRLADLNARFRDHTVKLFTKHGMENVAYWTPMPDQKGATNTLIYMLAHPSRESADAAFNAFRQDPEWKAALRESEERAGGSLTVSNGVKSVFLMPTDYSPMK